MVKKLSALLHREWNGLHEAAILMAGFALLSQVFALFRDRMLAHFFGAGPTLDIYYAAFRIPDLLFAGIASLMSALVFVPILTRHAMESDARAQKFLNDTFTVFFMFLVIVSVGIFFAVPKLIPALFHGLHQTEQAQIVMMTRIFLISPIFFGLSNLFGSVTQMLNKVFAFVLAPVLYNIGIIMGAAFLYPVFGMTGLAWGVMIGAFLNFFVYFFVSTRNGFGLVLSLRPSFLDLWEVVRVALPRTIILTTNQIALFALVVFAAKMEPGSITIFNFALDLQSFSFIVIGISYATATFLGLSRHVGGEVVKKFVEHITETSRHIIFWTLPAFIFLIVFRAQIVRIILESGAFDLNATKLTAAALAIFAISVVAQSIGLLFVRGLHATNNNAVPITVNIVSAALIIFLGYSLPLLYAHSPFFQYFVTSLLRVGDIKGAQVLMLPLAYSIGMLCNAALLIYFFQRRFDKAYLTSLKETFVYCSFASLVAGMVAYEFLEVLGLYLDLSTFRGVFLQGFGAAIAGVITWWLILRLSGNADIQEIREALHHKFWKAGMIIPGREEI